MSLRRLPARTDFDQNDPLQVDHRPMRCRALQCQQMQRMQAALQYVTGMLDSSCCRSQSISPDASQDDAEFSVHAPHKSTMMMKVT